MVSLAHIVEDSPGVTALGSRLTAGCPTRAVERQPSGRCRHHDFGGCECATLKAAVIRGIGQAISEESYHRVLVVAESQRQENHARSLLKERSIVRLFELARAGITAATVSRDGMGI